MAVSNKRVLFRFVVIVKGLKSVENALSLTCGKALRKLNTVEKRLYLVNNQHFFEGFLVIHRFCNMLLTFLQTRFVFVCVRLGLNN